MGLEKIIGVDAYGGDAVDGVLPEARIATAVAEVAAKHPDYFFILASSSYDVLTGYCDVPENVKVHLAEPEQRFGLIRELAQLVQDREIGGFYTLANTQVIMPVVDKKIGKIDELSIAFNGKARPPLIAELPKSPKVNRAKSWYLLDVGAIPQLTSPDQYLMYAKIGSLYAQLIGERQNPAVGLANIGSERGKGTEILRAAYELLSNSGLNFVGNVEPFCRTHDYDKGQEHQQRPVDVVVQDGFGGNEYIKVFADGAQFAVDIIKDEIKNGNILEKANAVMLGKAFARAKKRFDPGQYGGAPFLGLNAPVFKGHGTTMEDGIIVGLEKYIRYVEKGFIQKIKEELARPVVYANGNGIRS